MATSEAYSSAGVDLESAGQLKEVIKGLAQKTLGSNVVSGVGGFGGVIKLQENGDTYLVASADGVGTKLKLAAMTGRYDVAGEDIVNHCVNDILPAGARPLFFLDYVAMASYDADIVTKTVAGIAKACQAVGCALLGGETAAMPGVYRTGDYDLAGFIVGYRQQGQLCNRSASRTEARRLRAWGSVLGPAYQRILVGAQGFRVGR